MREATRILVTGFEPFGGSHLNPSREVLPRLLEARIPGIDLRTELLPVVGGDGPDAAPARLKRAIERGSPEILLCLGETGSRGAICLERCAVNRRDYRIPDNAGALVREAAVVPDGPPLLRSSLPIAALLAAMARAHAPVEASDDAGTFLCNEILYHALHMARRFSLAAAGFIHLPRLPEQLEPGSDRPALALERTAAALIAALETLRDWRCEQPTIAGRA